MSAGAIPAAADTPTSPPPAPCSVPVDPTQARLDEAGVASAHASELELTIVRQCAGFTVVSQNGVDPADANDYVTYAEQAYTALSAEIHRTLSPRTVLFIFADQDGMADGERVIAGINQLTREPHAGYAWMNSIWIDGSQMKTPALRARAVSHEFSHVFAAVVAHNRPIPSWFDEGVAVHSEINISADTFPVGAEARAGLERERVLDALSGAGKQPLFGLDEIDTNQKWLANFADPNKVSLQYAQAYETVRTAMGSHGRASAWAVLGAFGETGRDFNAAFRSVYGKPPAEYDALARAEWTKQLTSAPDSLQILIRLAGADVSLVQLQLDSDVGTRMWTAKGIGVDSGTYTFQIGPRGELLQTSGTHLDVNETVLDEIVSAHDTNGGLRVVVRRADRADAEQLVLTRSYGRWMPSSDSSRSLISLGAGDELSFTTLRGELSEPFPSGDSIVAQYPHSFYRDTLAT